MVFSALCNKICVSTLLGQKQNFVYVWIIIIDNSYLFVNAKKSKADNKNVFFPSQFFFRSISVTFPRIECKEVSVKGNVYEFSLNHGAIDITDI